ncbi:flagellar basal body P-ring formation chaperone FlgA [Rhodobaculum claviforme]|uniref:Flagella basal body P-ring formation protein FlgA n=1 Tax=Rhodobaculum claviforme TaxID=1549854 RepID=A0A934TMF3_9RHOB|nr:flagellar basal body P-ring formation chaperone FlgA [Rhodobaculum claviforme]MBK5928480.1 flagella basal body P-ring formation protein FlgA [Rhodobaculum claviforme]
MAQHTLAGAALIAALATGLPAPAETLVAARTIRATTLIEPGDVVVVPEVHPGALSHADEAVGLEARVALYPGRPIRPGDLGPAAVVERNGIVPLIFRRAGLTIFAEGRALGRGAPGEMVRVMNLSSRTTVSGMIDPEGRVHVSGSARPFH